MTARQQEVVEAVESADDWVSILSLRRLFHARTITAVIEQGLVIYHDGHVAPKSFATDHLDLRPPPLDFLMDQPIGRSMVDAARMMEQVEL